ncbi:response regulator transcription factor [Neoroseomonas soli]|uniref:Response regulator transcription factor n=1 Tax=Neoroseomonas soli TaxID=1081025 RepID=A0A9X9WZ30_9PROT|nr:response regulator transcription factor [Neoroseomonas soli]MBR0672409.1 response regulator transcription factor [Neoroseomonas soli]
MDKTSAFARHGHRILAVDRALVRPLASDLTKRGIAVAVAPSEEALIRGVADGRSDAVLLAADGVSGPSAADTVRRLRDLSRIPCVVVASPAEGIDERVAALEAGADEVLHTGIPPSEAIARIRAVLRRLGEPATDVAPWRLLPAGRRLQPPAGEELRLTGAEFALLAILASAGGDPVARDVLCERIFRRAWRLEDRAVDSLVRRLRSKLPFEAINSVRNIGYALAVPIEITDACV